MPLLSCVDSVARCSRDILGRSITVGGSGEINSTRELG